MDAQCTPKRKSFYVMGLEEMFLQKERELEVTGYN